LFVLLHFTAAARPPFFPRHMPETCCVCLSVSIRNPLLQALSVPPNALYFSRYAKH
jgi:hypothetical protein